MGEYPKRTKRATHKRVLVTGAGGFIGGHLVRHLLDTEHGAIVYAADRKPVRHWYQAYADATNLGGSLVRNLSPSLFERLDEVYHLAADMGGIGYITDHLVSCASNIVDTIHLLDSCHTDQRVFFSSSACVYPVALQARGGEVSLRESDAWPADPEPGYGFEKLYGEQMMEWHAVERGLVTRIARYHNVYGPHGSWNDGREKAPAAICRKVAIAQLSGDHTIDIWGDGEQVRSFMYVDDCVLGSVMIAHSDYPKPLNLGTEDWVTINELVSIIEKIAGVPTLRRVHDSTAPQGVRGRNSDNTLIKKKLGWEPSIKLETGIEKTYGWVYDQVKESMS